MRFTATAFEQQIWPLRNWQAGFLHGADETADDADDDGRSIGIVDHGNPVPTSRIAADLGRSRDRLESSNYIERSAAVGHAYGYKVQLLTE